MILDRQIQEDIERIKKYSNFMMCTLHVDQETISSNMVSIYEKDLLKHYSPLTKKPVENYIFYYSQNVAVGLIEINKCISYCCCRKINI